MPPNLPSKLAKYLLFFFISIIDYLSRHILFSRLNLSSEDTTKFIISVKNYPVLFDTSASDYKNVDAQTTARAAIADEFGCSKYCPKY